MMKKVLITAALLTMLAATPAMAGQWKQDWIGWYYLYDTGGYPTNGIYDIEGTKYCFDVNGYMITGWVQFNGEWHYCNSDGKMPAACWIKDNEKWYYLDKDNVMRTGWFNDGKNQYYLYKLEDVGVMKGAVEGAMATGTITVNGVTYYFDAEGKQVNTMKTFENNGINYRYEKGVFEWQNINNKKDWIQYNTQEEFVFDLQEQLIERYEGNHTYTSSLKFKEDARMMLKGLLDEDEIEEYIDDALGEHWGSSYSSRRDYDDD